VFKKSQNGKFALGKPLGTRQGTMKHDASTSAVKDRIHNDLNPSHNVVGRHCNVPSVGTETLAEVSSKGATQAKVGGGNS
jgi:hypothetical protein